MCAAMFVRGIAWHAIMRAALPRVRRRDAMQGTFIGVLMSATLPARLGELSRSLIVARRLGRARETLPVVTEMRSTVLQANVELERVDNLLGTAESISSTVDSASPDYW